MNKLSEKEVMEKWIDKKAKEMCKIANVEFFIYAQDFVRSIIEEVPVKKVSEKFIEEQVKGIDQLYINCDGIYKRFIDNMPRQLQAILKRVGISVA